MQSSVMGVWSLCAGTVMATLRCSHRQTGLTSPTLPPSTPKAKQPAVHSPSDFAAPRVPTQFANENLLRGLGATGSQFSPKTASRQAITPALCRTCRTTAAELVDDF